MTPNRWELAKQREDEERERRQRSIFDPWLTPWRALTIFGALSVLCLGIGLGTYAYDSPLRDPHLPTVTATVTKHFSGNGRPTRVHYRLPDGRNYDVVFDWRGRGQPAVGETVTLAYVPTEPTRFRVVGHAQHAYTFLFILSVLFAIGAVVMSQAVRVVRRRRPLETADAKVVAAEEADQRP